MVSSLNRVISWSFYALFFAVPLAFFGDTSELFEFNKMWLTFALAIIILAAWFSRMVFEKRFRVQRTPLDIPILLFLASQFISTIISLDPHTSLWGYYSRFNGGLLSLVTYALLYYAFVSNIKKDRVIGYLTTMLVSGLMVALWGLPSHFGYDPTCLLFRGTFDVSCWTVAFQPKVRIFSTLGQPDWLSAYLAALLPLSIGFGMLLWEKKLSHRFAVGLFLLSLLFYLDFLYAKSRGGLIGLIISLIIFFAWFFWEKRKHIQKLFETPRKLFSVYGYTVAVILAIALITFVVGTSVEQVDKFLLPGISQHFQSHPAAPAAPKPAAAKPTPAPVSTGELGGTDSGKIRLFVWTGALKAWEHYPIFGTGVETFAYAYYLFMPPGHNLTSEFGYLYNKAHNEYLNYLATTGIVGLGTYLFMVAVALFFMVQGMKKAKDRQYQLLSAAFITSYIGILIINFFGFSVVVINMFLFLFPGFVFLLQDQLDENKAFAFPQIEGHETGTISTAQWVVACGLALVALYMLYVLAVYWSADRAYGLGQNYVNAQDYTAAYKPLHDAVSMRPSEPMFQDELALDDAVVAVELAQQNKSVTGMPTQLAQEAVATSNDVTTNHPNVVTYWKTRVRIMYSLAQLNPQYMQDALTAIEKAAQLAPTDAKVSYNLGLVQGQTGHAQEAIATLQHTVQLKSDYRDAYYALGLFYHAAGVDKSGKVINADYVQKGVDEMHFVLNTFGPDLQATEALKAWGVQ